jgi:glyoxylase-like metal-dependent hydrolase (beta-lactamase superfamily II)
MSFLTEPEPARGEPHPILPGIRRVVAPNPSVMTYWGTNTYLIDTPGGVLLLDPGPDDAGHVAAVLAVAGAPIVAILLSHTHHDHLGATAAMRASTGAPVHAWHSPADPAFVPDVPMHDGDEAFGWHAIHTPGHAPDHLCFAGPGGVVFSADHVMGWSSSVVGPPGGNMRQYFASLERMMARDDQLYLPGHGPPLPQPRAFVADLLAHRQAREAAILAALGHAPQSAAVLMEQLYSKVDPMLKRAAERNVMAHLLKLAEEGRARDTGTGWVAA